eukprot:7024071-Alexandrium_andersonii.AAC.1
MSASLVGSEMCIRDRVLKGALMAPFCLRGVLLVVAIGFSARTQRRMRRTLSVTRAQYPTPQLAE